MDAEGETLKTLEFEKYTDLKHLMNDNYQAILTTDNKAVGERVVKVKVIYEFEPYQIKVIRGLNGCHIVDNGPDNRMPYDEFMKTSV